MLENWCNLVNNRKRERSSFLHYSSSLNNIYVTWFFFPFSWKFPTASFLKELKQLDVLHPFLSVYL